MHKFKAKERELLKDLFINIIPTQSMTLNVLNGHLVIEGLLQKLIMIKLADPEKFDDLRLSFSQTVTLVQALYPDEIESWVYEAIKKLNTLRNKCAHVLDHQNIDNFVSNFTSLAYSACDELSANEKKKSWYSVSSDVDKQELEIFENIARSNQNIEIRLPESIIYIAKYLFSKISNQ